MSVAKAKPAPTPALTLPQKRLRAAAVDEELKRLYPQAYCGLVHENAFQLLVATVLSAQTTDKRVNTVTPTLFAKYPDARSLAGAQRETLTALLRPLGMQRLRCERLLGLGQALEQNFAGQVPANREALMTLPGVGRKTANVVLGNAFGGNAITVDTHVGRLSRRLGWTRATNPLAVERDLAALWDESRWTYGCHRLIAHGRAICRARQPHCSRCSLLALELCPQVGVNVQSA